MTRRSTDQQLPVDEFQEINTSTGSPGTSLLTSKPLGNTLLRDGRTQMLHLLAYPSPVLCLDGQKVTCRQELPSIRLIGIWEMVFRKPSSTIPMHINKSSPQNILQSRHFLSREIETLLSDQPKQRLSVLTILLSVTRKCYLLFLPLYTFFWDS